MCRNASIHTVNLNRQGLLMSWENAATAPQAGAHLEIQDGCRYLVAVEAFRCGFRQLQAPELPLANLLAP